MKVVLYGRSGCCLCEEALAELKEFQAERIASGLVSFTVEEVDIESDDQLHRRFMESIPVIELDGQVISDLAFDRYALSDALADRNGRQG